MSALCDSPRYVFWHLQARWVYTLLLTSCIFLNYYYLWDRVEKRTWWRTFVAAITQVRTGANSCFFVNIYWSYKQIKKGIKHLGTCGYWEIINFGAVTITPLHYTILSLILVFFFNYFYQVKDTGLKGTKGTKPYPSTAVINIATSFSVIFRAHNALWYFKPWHFGGGAVLITLLNNAAVIPASQRALMEFQRNHCILICFSDRFLFGLFWERLKSCCQSSFTSLSLLPKWRLSLVIKPPSLSRW